MRLRGNRLTLGRMMAIIGLVALILALRRVDSAPAVSLCVFAACAWYLASRRFAEAMARRAAEGLTTAGRNSAHPPGGRERRRRGHRPPDAAFLAGYYRVHGGDSRHDHRCRIGVPTYDPWHMTMGMVVGIIVLRCTSRRSSGIGSVPILGGKSRPDRLTASLGNRSVPHRDHERVPIRG